MIRLILAYLILLLTLDCFAQRGNPPSLYEGSEKNEKKITPELPNMRLNMAIGAAFPQGKYISTAEYEQAGYAAGGIYIGVDGDYKLFKFGGANLEITWAYNPYNKEAFLIDIGNLLYENDISLDKKIVWQHFYCLTGPYLAIASNNTIIDFALKIGYAYSRLPEISLVGDNYAYTYNRNGLEGSSVAFGSHFRLSQKINKHWYAALKAGFVSFAPNFTEIQEGNNALKGYYFKAQNATKQPISIINFSLGITYIFRKKLHY